MANKYLGKAQRHNGTKAQRCKGAIDFLCAPCSGINTGSNRPDTGDMIIHRPGNILLPSAQKTKSAISEKSITRK